MKILSAMFRWSLVPTVTALFSLAGVGYGFATYRANVDPTLFDQLGGRYLYLMAALGPFFTLAMVYRFTRRFETDDQWPTP